MAMWQESWIMSEIGLGNHFSWYNGGSCAYIRREAVRKLPEVIQAHHDAYRMVDALMKAIGRSAHSAAISPPIGVLIALVREVSEYLDTSAYSLTKTWQCASDVIEAHLYAGAHAGRDSEMTYVNACVDGWTPRIREASQRIDVMGFYAEDYLHGRRVIGKKFRP